MRILNFGSLNIDHVYALEKFVRPGETVACSSYTRSCGGKGLNQSIALAHGGGEVYHAGQIGHDGEFLKTYLADHGVHTECIRTVDTPTGHAVIQVDREGENAIVVAAGANYHNSREAIQTVLGKFSRGDWLLVQNEICMVGEIIRQAKKNDMQIAFNPAPFTVEVRDYQLELVDIFIVNETEARGITGETTLSGILSHMRSRFPHADVLYTRGAQGAVYMNREFCICVPAVRVEPLDTTGAGDTFIGFFLSGIAQEQSLEAALAGAAAAAAISVTRPGAAASIPSLSEVEKFQAEKSGYVRKAANNGDAEF